MRTIHIPKKSGGLRTIYVQGPWDKNKYRRLAWRLDTIRRKLYPELADVIHGFTLGRSPVTNALAHVGKRWTLTIDIAEFFDSVRAEQFQVSTSCPSHYGIHPGLALMSMAGEACVDGHPRQGLSSSPAACNLAAAFLDKRILDHIKVHKMSVVYTRYADDMTFSSDSLSTIHELRDAVPRWVEAMGWKVNPKKTRLQSAAYGYRRITGISVGDTDIRVPRSFRRKLRAALHQHPESNKTRGLQEWAKLKPPRGGKIRKMEQYRIREVAPLAFARPLPHPLRNPTQEDVMLRFP